MRESEKIVSVDATEGQIEALRELGLLESELEGLSFEDAEELIAELRAVREDAGRFDEA